MVSRFRAASFVFVYYHRRKVRTFHSEIDAAFGLIQYHHPTQRQMVYLILTDKGFERDDLARIQNISASSLRSIRARLNARKNNDKQQ